MNDELKIVKAIGLHGDGLGTNLVYFKKFLQAQQREQQEFLAEQRAASDHAQKSANIAAVCSAVAAVAAAVAAAIQAWDAFITP